MAFPASFIDEVVARNPIEDVVGQHVNLRRSGANMFGLCPFHGEKTASFNLYPETNSFYCFGCGAGGDVITFIKRIENLEYMDAVRLLADRSGMKMPEQRNENDQTSRLRMRILEANREAARLYHAALYRPEGRVALEYYHSRGYTDATIKHLEKTKEALLSSENNLRLANDKAEDLSAIEPLTRRERSKTEWWHLSPYPD